MGAACCIASRDKTIQGGSTGDSLHRNIRCSPTWSFRRDRGRVAGEDTSINWFPDGINRNHGSKSKNESAYVSEDGSPLQNHQRNTCHKSPISEGTVANVRNYTSDNSFSRDVSMDANAEQVKGLAESSIVSCPSPTKQSLPSTSLVASPLSSQRHIPPSNSNPLKWSCHSPGHQRLWQISDSQIPAFKSPSRFSVSEERPTFPIPSWSNESGMHSRDGSLDGWSVPGISEPMGTPLRERLSFGSESFGFNCEALVGSSSQFSTSPVDLQTCGVCSRFLTEKSCWSSQKIIASNDLSVVAVLVCGHMYHAECLETMTLDADKYDPACPVCTFGEVQTMKLSEKALRACMDSKTRNMKSRSRIVDSDIDDDSVVFDHFKGRGHKSKGPRMDSSSSWRSSFGKPFLRRHFSFGSKSGSKSMLDNHPTRKKGFFWAKSSKE